MPDVSEPVPALEETVQPMRCGWWKQGDEMTESLPRLWATFDDDGGDEG